jgi:hypothetical protein
MVLLRHEVRVLERQLLRACSLELASSRCHGIASPRERSRVRIPPSPLVVIITTFALISQCF